MKAFTEACVEAFAEPVEVAFGKHSRKRLRKRSWKRSADLSQNLCTSAGHRLTLEGLLTLLYHFRAFLDNLPKSHREGKRWCGHPCSCHRFVVFECSQACRVSKVPPVTGMELLVVMILATAVAFGEEW